MSRKQYSTVFSERASYFCRGIQDIKKMSSAYVFYERETAWRHIAKGGVHQSSATAKPALAWLLADVAGQQPRQKAILRLRACRSPKQNRPADRGRTFAF
jgi:hypothetical protein